MEVAFSVSVIPRVFSKSESVPQVSSPSFKTSVFTVFPAEDAFPVVSIMPFSKGKLEASCVKTPKLPMPITFPFIEELIFVISTHSCVKVVSTSCCTDKVLSTEICCAIRLRPKQQ